MTGPANDPVAPAPSPFVVEELYYLLDEVLSNRREKQKEVTWITSLSGTYRDILSEASYWSGIRKFRCLSVAQTSAANGRYGGEKMCEKKSCEMLLQFASQTTVSDAIKGKVLNCWRFVGLAKQQAQQNTQIKVLNCNLVVVNILVLTFNVHSSASCSWMLKKRLSEV